MLTNPNRAVAALTPLVFAPAAGAIAALAAKHGLELDGGELTAIFVTGATIAFAKAGIWMKGWQDYEKRELDARDAPVSEFLHEGPDPDEDVESDLDLDPIDDLADSIDDLEADFAAAGR